MLHPINPGVRFQPHLLEKNFPRERVTVCVQAIRRQAENDVAGFDSAAIDHLRAFDDADDTTSEIVLAFAVHSRHLRSLSADQSAAGRATSFGKTGEQLIEDARLQFLRADVIEKKKRARAENGNVVHAMIHKIGADGVVPA